MPPQELPLTPAQTEGPFYPETAIERQLINDNDLLQKLPGHEYAQGQPMVVSGVVKNQRGEPLAGSVVEIWQACASGRYSHSRDEGNAALLDNNFQFWGRAITEADGKYTFKTIIPGKYPGRTGRHIHYRIDSENYQRLSTQCYFSEFGEDNARDGIYRNLQRHERDQVTIEVDKSTVEKSAVERRGGQQLWSGTFDIVLGKRS
jgi:protocatechuate 3,4-dioxygenase beta subunit